MKLHRILLPVLSAAVALTAGCKKSNPESKTLDGYLVLSVPAYMEAGETKSFQIDTLMNLSCPDDEPIGYYFKDGTTSESDTLVTADGVIRKRDYTFTAPAQVGSASLTLGAFMPAGSLYSAVSATVYTTVVCRGITGGSITGFDKTGPRPFTDWRDGREYYYDLIGDLYWMRQNLAWEESGRAYDGCEVMTDVFGRYYTWEEAQFACPFGWRLPTDAEWTALQDGAEADKDIAGLAGRLMGNLYFNGERMWEYWRDVQITDEFRFSAIPVGYAEVAGAGAEFSGLFSYAAFWTADESDGQGICRYIYQDKDIVFRGRMSKTDFAASVRCVRE